MSPRSPLARRRLLIGGLGGLAALAAGPAALRAMARTRGLRTATRAGLAFGTTVSLTLVHAEAAAIEAGFRAGFAAIRAVEAAGSLYRPDSALARLNRDGLLADPDPLLAEMLGFALDLAAASGGAFDPTVQPLWTLWAAAAARGERPGAAALADTLGRVGWRAVARSEAEIRLRPGSALTLNGLLQGYAADRVMGALGACGIAHAFVDTASSGRGGRTRTARPGGSGWRGRAGATRSRG